MAISLKLIQDPRYNSIEEKAESEKDVVGIRDRSFPPSKIFKKSLFQSVGDSQE